MSEPDPKRVRVLIVEDSELVRAGLRAVLRHSTELEIVGDAANVREAVTAFTALKPDVVLMDMRLPDGTGVDACRAILELRPDARVLFLTSTAEPASVDDAIRAGACGYLLKEINPHALIQALRDAASGKSTMDPAVSERVRGLLRTSQPAARTVLDSLSPQEKRIVALIAEGMTNKEVANSLGLAEKTVKNYLNNVFEKLHVSRRTEAAALFQQSTPPRP